MIRKKKFREKKILTLSSGDIKCIKSKSETESLNNKWRVRMNSWKLLILKKNKIHGG
jgi:hypothetical protein